MAAKFRLTTDRGVWSGAYRELLRPRTVAVAGTSVVLFAVAMTIFGPLGTLAALEPLPRFAYWGLCAGITFPLTYSVAAVALYLTRHRSLIEIVAAVAVAVLFEGVLCTAVVIAADLLLIPARTVPLSPIRTYLTVTVVVAVCTFFAHYAVFQRISQGHTAAAVADAAAPGAGSPPGRRDAPRVVAGGGAAPPGAGSASGAAALLRSRTELPAEARPEPPSRARTTAPAGRRSATRPPLTASQARFHDRLSHAVSRDIIYLKADDHYVNVRTSAGSCLVRKRFANAVADLGALGVQVHRSYWVAHRHMVTTVRRDGRTMLRVTGGEYVPISRPYLATVRDALRAKSFPPAGADHIT